MIFRLFLFVAYIVSFGAAVPKLLAAKWIDSVDAVQSIEKVVDVDVSWCYSQSGRSCGTHELGRNHQEALAQALKCCTLPARGNAKALEPIQQVVGHQDNLKES